MLGSRGASRDGTSSSIHTSRSRHLRIGYKNIPVSIDDAPKAVQGERNVVTAISARSAQCI